MHKSSHIVLLLGAAFLVPVMASLIGCGDAGLGNTNDNGDANANESVDGDAPIPPDSDIASPAEAAEAIVAMGDAQMYAYASLLEMFSDDGTRPLFDMTVELDDSDYETITEITQRVVDMADAYEAASVFLLNQSESPAAKLVYVNHKPRFPKGFLGAMKDFFIGWARGNGSRRAEDIAGIATQVPAHEREAMFQTARDRFGEQVGNNSEEFFANLVNGDLNNISAQMHKDFSDNPIDLPGYVGVGQNAGKRPLDIAAEEGARGLQAGAQVVIQGNLVIICSKFPKFCTGFDKAEKIIDKLNDIGEDPLGALGDEVKDGIVGRGQEWLGDKTGVSVDLEAVSDKFETFTGVVKNLGQDSDDDFGVIDTVFSGDDDQDGSEEGTTSDDVEVLVLSGDEDDGNPVVVVVPGDGDGEETDITVPDGDYNVTVIGDEETTEVPGVNVPPGNSTVILVDLEGEKPTEGNFSMSMSASPADPGPSESVVVTVRILPATEGVQIDYSVSGTDGYYNSGSPMTNSDGLITFSIPGGAEGIVDTVSATITSTGSSKSFSYVF